MDEGADLRALADAKARNFRTTPNVQSVKMSAPIFI